MDKKYGYHWPEYGKKGLLTNRFERASRETCLERLEDTLQWVYNHSINLYLDNTPWSERKAYSIDRWDTWSMDHSLAPIILPMLVQLNNTKHGSPFTDDEDVPESIRSTNAAPKENEHEVDEFHHARWEWVLDEMIWAFEQKVAMIGKDDYYKYEEDPDYLASESNLFGQDPKGAKHTKHV